MTSEIRVARRVEEVNARGVTIQFRIEARDRKLERMMQLLLSRRIVADCSAALDAAGCVDRPRFREQRLGQSSLATARLTDERDRPNLTNGTRHRLTPALFFLLYSRKIAR